MYLLLLLIPLILGIAVGILEVLDRLSRKRYELRKAKMFAQADAIIEGNAQMPEGRDEAFELVDELFFARYPMSKWEVILAKHRG